MPKHHAMKTYEIKECNAPYILNSTLHRGKWSASCPFPPVPTEGDPVRLQSRPASAIKRKMLQLLGIEPQLSSY